jgi:hypothetical protein
MAWSLVMSHPALTIIRDEHGALSAMLRSLSMLLAEHRRHGSLPDFSVLRAMLFYVDEFPEQLHHTKESELLFPKLRARCARDRLGARPGSTATTRAASEGDPRPRARRCWPSRCWANRAAPPSRQAVERYIEFYLGHMRVRGSTTVHPPAAKRLFTEADWVELDAAFAANKDPLTGHEPEDGYRPLFRKIVQRGAGADRAGLVR